MTTEKNIYTFVLSFGYKGARLSYLPFTSLGKFANDEIALVDLANYFKEAYQKKSKARLEPCCHSCGSPLKEKEFSREDFIYWLEQLSICDVNTFYGEFIEDDDDARWQPLRLDDAPNQRFVYQAELVLAAAIGCEKDFEKICQDRTERKRKSFSYYG